MSDTHPELGTGDPSQYELVIEWPNLTSPVDASNEEILTWLADPFLRRILYVAYSLYEIARFGVTALITLVSLFALYEAFPQLPHDSASLVWISLGLATVVLAVDGLATREYRSLLSRLTVRVVAPIMFVTAQLYGLVRHGETYRRETLEIFSSDLIGVVPQLRLSQRDWTEQGDATDEVTS